MTARPKELMIYVRGKWEIAHIQRFPSGKTAWHRRDQSWICDETGENIIEGVAPLPPKPSKTT